MKKVFSFAISGVAIAAAAYIGYTHHQPKAEYLQAAETRVGSYLTSDYGRVACHTTQISGGQWLLDCLNAAKGQHFEYAVFPAEKAPYAVSRLFYLEAVNENAVQSASHGLMQYLQINTSTHKIHS
ncbi:hypothetical protein [Lelliottia sp. CFBP8978]|uniref:hypothetical protein n=1 Tax=Lelliottia sp. CFBP8978 TaxID=3096522 RepID=UPI002A6AD52C|nr:hypothetical protein [Lelliottia sp. CFBP8978]MDY1035668.1 hypothetical protein [Lelliottia sp. CFBP8978]